MGRYMREAGHTVRYVTSDAFGRLPDDHAAGVIRTPDLKAAGSLRRVLRRGPLSGAGTGAYVEPPAPAILTKVIVPDANLISWVPGATRAIRRLLATGEVDCVVTTGPPDSVHVIGLGLGQHRAAWVADFRDGWTFESLRERFPTAPQRRLDFALERRVVHAADGVAAVTTPIADDLRDRLGVDVAVIPNGYDPALDSDAEAAELPELPSDRVLLVHTGALSGPRGRSSVALINALHRLAEEDPESAERLLVVQVGPHSEADEARLTGLRDRGRIITLGPQSRAVSLALQRRADALLLVTSDDVSQATGKLFEYLAARRPVLALAAGNEAERIILETGTGITVGADDVDAITAGLRAVATGTISRRFAPRGIERYVYPAPAAAMAQLIEAAVERRSSEVRGSRRTTL